MPRQTTATAFGLLVAALLIVLGATVGVAAADPGNGQARGHDAGYVKPGNGPKGTDAPAPGPVPAEDPPPAADPGPEPTNDAPGPVDVAPAPVPPAPVPPVPVAAPVAPVLVPPGLVTTVARSGGTDLGPAVAAPATATSAAEPGAGVAEQVAAGPGTNDPPPTATSAPTTDEADIPTATALPRVAVANLVAHPPASLAVVLALLLAVLLFLVLHPVLDRHDERLAVAGVDADIAQFQ